jgi:hypothetical protein
MSGNCHQQYTKCEHTFATICVAEASHHDAAQRARQIPDGKDTVGLKLTQPFRKVRRKT